MDFNDLYLFVGPPMTRGPPQLSLLPLLPPPPPAVSAPLLPPMLPRPPMSQSKRTQKHNVRQQPYHRRKPSHRNVNFKSRTKVESVELCEDNEREMQMLVPELEIGYRTARKCWPSISTRAIDTQATYSSVLDMCPQFFALEPIIGEYF
ncbi:hypothetical protein Plhal304r1_c027g0090331 [Plasmopara halstedii]